MKKILLAGCLAGTLLLIQSVCEAQVQKSAYQSNVPEWVPAEGHWVVESNRNTPLLHTIRFYNDKNELVYKEELKGIRLQLKKARVKMQLKLALEKVLSGSEKHQLVGENQAIVLNLLKGKATPGL